MQQAFSSKNSPKVSSISRRFSYAFIGIITLLLIAFAAVVILFNISRMEKWMEMRLDNAIMFAQNSLPIPLWNMDYTVVNDFVEALFLDESIVYSKISWKDQLITEKKRPGFQLKKIKLETPLKSLKGADLIAKSSKIYFKDSVISEILIVMSREKLKKQVLFQIYGTIALLILIIAAIWLTSIFITRRYISSPLLKLQESASLIARGDLDTFVDKSSSDSGDHSLVGPLGSLLAEEADASIRRHAAWALGRLGGAGARVALEKQSADPDAAVREEVAAALEGLD
jgi:methyl-accepting chemotaxis protein